MTPKLFGIQSNISSKFLQLESSNLVDSFLLEKPRGGANNSPQKGRGLGHVTVKKFVANDPKYLENYFGYRLQIWSVLANSHMECRLLLK